MKESTKLKQFCHPEQSEGSQSEILREDPQNDKFSCLRGKISIKNVDDNN